MTISLAVLGATGKMGKRILQLAIKDPLFHVVGAVARTDPAELEKKSPVAYSQASEEVIPQCDVAIDFTSHEATLLHLEAAVESQKPLVIGTTGHSLEAKKAIEESAKKIPILYSPNFSFGIALCLEAVSRFAKVLGGKSTIDILESHHIHKKDRPSGTAFAFAQAAAYGKTVVADESSSPRRKEEIAIHSIRTGEVIGEHTIIFECGHERIELKHIAHSRDAFAQGALLGAKFLVNQPAGLYSLKNLFN